MGNPTLFGGAEVFFSQCSLMVLLEKRSDTVNKGALSSCYSLFSTLRVQCQPNSGAGRNTAQWPDITEEQIVCFTVKRTLFLFQSHEFHALPKQFANEFLRSATEIIMYFSTNCGEHNCSIYTQVNMAYLILEILNIRTD